MWVGFLMCRLLLFRRHTTIDYLLAVQTTYSSETMYIRSRMSKDCLQTRAGSRSTPLKARDGAALPLLTGAAANGRIQGETRASRTTAGRNSRPSREKD